MLSLLVLYWAQYLVIKCANRQNISREDILNETWHRWAFRQRKIDCI
jgi:hypothetical protein